MAPADDDDMQHALEAALGSVGGDLVGAAISGVTSHPVEVGLAAALGLSALGAFRSITERLRRRRRGRWGVLQDRFTALAATGASGGGVSNPQRAASLNDARAAALALLLDRVAFDPDWQDTDGAYQDARSALDDLEKTRPSTDRRASSTQTRHGASPIS